VELVPTYDCKGVGADVAGDSEALAEGVRAARLRSPFLSSMHVPTAGGDIAAAAQGGNCRLVCSERHPLPAGPGGHTFGSPPSSWSLHDAVAPTLVPPRGTTIPHTVCFCAELAVRLPHGDALRTAQDTGEYMDDKTVGTTSLVGTSLVITDAGTGAAAAVAAATASMLPAA
jgi:hypothetical protein